MTDKQKFTCSHEGCDEHLPGSHQGQEIPPGWTVARVEEHGAGSIRFYYLYLCPKHMITSTERQANENPIRRTPHIYLDHHPALPVWLGPT